MSRKSVRLLFLGVFALLLAQFLLAKWDEEPYPAIMFPGFGQVITADALYPYQYERLVIQAYTATDTIPLTLKELLLPFPDTHPEDALLAPVRVKLRHMSNLISKTNGSPSEKDLRQYLRMQAQQQLGREVRKLKLIYRQYEAQADGAVQLTKITHQKIIDFQ